MEYPEEVDLVILGTGFIQAVIACAAARRGKSLFILDANESYGECGASLGWGEFQAWAQAHARPHSTSSDAPSTRAASAPSDAMPPGVTAVPVPLAAPDVQAVQSKTHVDIDAAAPRGYCIDLVHQALEATGPCAQAIRDIGLHHSLEFAAVSSVFTWHCGRLHSTPSSKADVHSAPWLSVQDKRTLSLFLANAQHAAAGGSSNLFQATHFKAALEDFGLHPSVQEGLLYSVFQAEDRVTRDTPLAGEDVLEAMVKYMSQSGAYVAGQAPYIESRYGCCEVAQAFIRQACVYGGAIALGTPISDILVRDGAVHGVRTASGQVIRCSALCASPGYLGGFTATAPEALGAVAGDGEGPAQDENSEERAAEAEEAVRRGKTVARGIVVLRQAVLPHLTTCQIVFPPGACGNDHTVTVWHSHHTLGVCPAPAVLLHLAMPRVEDGAAALQALQACVAALLRVPDDADGKPAPVLETGREANDADGARQEEDLIMAECYYLQDLSGGDALQLCEGVVCCPAAGREWTLDEDLLRAERLFRKVYPDDVFLTKTPPVTANSMKDEEDVDPLDAALKGLGLA